MNYGQAFYTYEAELAGLGLEPESLAYAFLELTGWTRTDLILAQNQDLTPDHAQLLADLMVRLRTHEPAQYITGQAYFRDLTLSVDPRVLIPRPETEELVELILLENSRADLRVLDMGTGSGAIALSLAQSQSSWAVTASDLSADALAVATANADKHGLTVSFVQSDAFDQLEGVFDVIVSNPPYIAYADEDEVGSNVLRHEPHTALFAEEEGLAIYRKIADGAPAHLTKDGKIYLEIGYKQGASVSTLMQTAFPDKRVRVLKDSLGKDRMVVVDNG